MKRITDEQIISILREAEAGVSSRELCRKDARFYTWRKMYGGLEVPEVKRLKSLKEDNASNCIYVTGQITQNVALKGSQNHSRMPMSVSCRI